MVKNKSTQVFTLLFLLIFKSIFAGDTISISSSHFTINVNNTPLSAPEVLSRYIQHKSISGTEKQAGEWLKAICEENGLYITQFGDINGNYNFAASIYPLSDSLPNIILLNHIDVVDPGDPELWLHPPWSGYISDTEVWGRGAFDNKGAAIMQLFTILKYKSEMIAENHEFNVTFLAVSVEEVFEEGGAKYVVENYLEDLNPEIVVGEGATELSALVNPDSNKKQFGISITQKRPAWLHLTLNVPTSGHGSAPPDTYANKELTIALSRLMQKKHKAIFNEVNLNMLRSLGDNERGITKFILKHPVIFTPLIIPQLRQQAELFALYSNTIALTVLDNNNSTINTIPGTAEAYLDCRLMPEYSTEQFIREIKKVLKNDSIEIELIIDLKEAEPSDSNGQHYRYMKEAVENIYPGASVYPIMLPNFNDVSWFRVEGIQGISIIPVELEEDHLRCVHKENERIPILALYQGIDTYVEFLHRYNSN